MEAIENREGYDDLAERIISLLTPEEVMRHFTLEQRLAGLTPEELLAGLSPREREALRKFLDETS